MKAGVKAGNVSLIFPKVQFKLLKASYIQTFPHKRKPYNFFSFVCRPLTTCPKYAITLDCFNAIIILKFCHDH